MDYNYSHQNNYNENTSKNINEPFFITLIVLVGVVVLLLIVLIVLLVKAFYTTYSLYESNNDNNIDNNNNNKKHGGKNKFSIRGSLENMRKNNRHKKYLNKLNYQNNNIPNNKNDSSGWQLYTLKGCGHCTKQLSELNGFNTFVEFARGESDPIINNISGELYPKEKINGFPFWYNSKTGEKKMGRQDVCELTPKIMSANC
jgi:hypothetical protein